MGSAAAVEQARLSETLRTSAESAGGAAPRQLVHVIEQMGVGPQRRQILEEEGQTAALSQHGGREVLEDASPVQQPCPRGRTDPRAAALAAARLTDAGEANGN